MDIQKIREQFPITRNAIFINHAGVSPVSIPVKNAIFKHIEDVSEYGSIHVKQWDDTCKKTRRLFAELINVPVSQVAIMKNTTESINVIAAGFPWKEGDNVVITNAEYPANVYPWMNQSEKKVEVRCVQESNGRIELEDILAKVDNRTRIIAVSFVEFASGFRNPLANIGEFCKKRGILFVVDAIQGLGALELDATKMNIDALTTGMHKWLLGPCGVGLFYIRTEWLEKLKIWYVGADSVVNAEDYLEYKLALLPGARRLEYAMLNYPGIAGALSALELVGEMGLSNIQFRLKHLTDLLTSQLEQKGYTIYSPRGENEWSGIISCSTPSHDANALLHKLTEHKIYASVRAGRLRLSPHYYQTGDELMQLMEILPE